MNFGYFIKKDDASYDVFVKPDTKLSGYNVVPLEIDPHNKYNLSEVIEYALGHPEMELPQWETDPPSYDEICADVRAERSNRIIAVRWRIERHDDEIRLGLASSESIEPVLQYIQELRDITIQPGFPQSVVWPVEPQ